jgi:hypothetical protein
MTSIKITAESSYSIVCSKTKSLGHGVQDNDGSVKRKCLTIGDLDNTVNPNWANRHEQMNPSS